MGQTGPGEPLVPPTAPSPSLPLPSGPAPPAQPPGHAPGGITAPRQGLRAALKTIQGVSTGAGAPKPREGQVSWGHWTGAGGPICCPPPRTPNPTWQPAPLPNTAFNGERHRHRVTPGGEMGGGVTPARAAVREAQGQIDSVRKRGTVKATPWSGAGPLQWGTLGAGEIRWELQKRGAQKGRSGGIRGCLGGW